MVVNLMNPSSALGRRPFLTTMLVFVALVLLTGAGLLIWGRYQGMDTIADHLDTARPWLTVWRLTVYGLVIGGWPRWIAILARRGGWNQTYRTQLLALRWRLALWILILELLLVQNLVGQFLQVFIG